MAMTMLAACGWSLVAALEAAAVPQASKILFSTLEYVGSGSVAVLFLLFAARYTQRTSWMTRGRVTALWLLPLAAIALTATNAWHHIVWTAFEPARLGSNSLIYHHGVGFFAILACIYAYILVASRWLVLSALRASPVQKRQSMTILIATAFPWVAGILYAIGITLVPGLNLAPVSMALTGTVLAVGTLPLRLFDLVPVARDRLVEGMGDAIVVTDASRRIVDFNPAARKLLQLPAGTIGADVAGVLPFWKGIAADLQGDHESRFELILSEDPLVHIDLRIAPLMARAHETEGLLIVLRDTTVRHRAERALQNANDRLQAQVREIERLQSKLRDQAIRDSLTGLYNRRHLDDMMPRILDRAGADSIPISVVMFDIDDFKKVNDAHGHAVGDALLVRLGEILAERTRPGDIACRYGGEEFVLVLPEASLAASIERAEELRRAFAAASVPGLGSDRTPTLSAGVAVFPRHGAMQDELLRSADEALYRAKASGKDSVCRAVDAPESERRT